MVPHGVWNDDVRQSTKQPRSSAIVQPRRVSLSGHVVRNRCKDLNSIPPWRTGGDHQDVLGLCGWRLSIRTL